MAKLTFTDDEKEVLRFLDERFHAGAKWVDVSSVPLPNGCDEQWRDRIVSRLETYGLIRFDSNSSFVLDPRIAELVYQLNNPPKPNYWKSTIEWWFSAKWRAAITVLTILLPLIVQWVEMIKTVLRWIGVLDSTN
ncbi:hypothetical protein [Rhodopirellula bahusiensis]|uniref:hypothetical protein n=1 Tax=Rhodopirellula bahusiensis TaxID=2014065 RepID=UPI0032647356